MAERLFPEEVSSMIDLRTLALLATAALLSACEPATRIDEAGTDADDIATDGTATDANTDMESGADAAGCAMGRMSCGGTCVDTNSDPSNCGHCGSVCPSGTNQTAFCERGTCRATCATGYTDCDSMAANGCEANTATDPDHCGGCGMACALANAVAICTAGSCAIASCAEGFADCDGMASTGCEAAVNTVEHCGTCGRACGSAGTTMVACTAGACVPTCDVTHGDCDGDPTNGCEAALNTAANCGGCGVSCANPTDNCCFEVAHNPGACVSSTFSCF
jgi:hypothetical protein